MGLYDSALTISPDYRRSVQRLCSAVITEKSLNVRYFSRNQQPGLEQQKLFRGLRSPNFVILESLSLRLQRISPLSMATVCFPTVMLSGLNDG